MIALTVILFLTLTQVPQDVSGEIPSATIRSPFIRISDGSRRLGDEAVDRNYYDNNYYYISPRRSYVIYDDVRSMPSGQERNQASGGPRAWHLQFNMNRQYQQHQHHQHHLSNRPMFGSQSVYSNVIQIVDDPKEKIYLGPYNGKGFYEDGKRYPTYLRPVEVPNYEIIYPFESQRDNIYYNDKLPDKFPPPFSPNNKFQFKDPPPVVRPQKDIGFYRAHTINYNGGSQKRDSSDRCNYIRLNDKGFPLGQEGCGRSISDIILEDYPTTGELILEHRKQYRGSYPERNRKESETSANRRSKRSPDYWNSRNNDGYSCCNDRQNNYGGYEPYNYENMGYGGVRLVSRPYQGSRENGNYGGYGYRNNGGQRYGNDDDFGEETSNNRGLTSYLSQRGRGDRKRYEDSDEEEKDSEESKSNNNNNNNNNNKNNSGNSGNDKKNSQNNKTSNNSRRNQSSSKSDGDSYSSSGHDNRQKGRQNSQRNSGDSYESYGRGNNDNYNSGRSGSGNGRGSFGYTRNLNSGRNYGSNGYYSGYNGGYNGGYGSSYNGGGFSGAYGRNSGYGGYSYD